MMPARPLLPLVNAIGRDELRTYLSARVDIDEVGCWNWRLSTNEHGYANLRLHGFENVKGHRLSWVVEHGVEAPKHLAACHRCDNRRCINPSHIFLGTPHENAKDRKVKGRYGAFRAHPAISRETNPTPYLRRKALSKEARSRLINMARDTPSLSVNVGGA